MVAPPSTTIVWPVMKEPAFEARNPPRRRSRPALRCASVYETLERPLVAVLARMEQRGVAIDREMLSRLSGDFAQSMARLEDEIARMVGAPFNPGSPKQLGDILFGQMGLPGGNEPRPGPGRQRSACSRTSPPKAIELPAHILNWRGFSKLKSTYADALPSFVDPSTGRGEQAKLDLAVVGRDELVSPRGGSIRLTRSPPRPPGGCRRRSPICRTFRCAPRKGADPAHLRPARRS